MVVVVVVVVMVIMLLFSRVLIFMKFFSNPIFFFDLNGEMCQQARKQRRSPRSNNRFIDVRLHHQTETANKDSWSVCPKVFGVKSHNAFQTRRSDCRSFQLVFGSDWNCLQEHSASADANRCCLGNSHQNNTKGDERICEDPSFAHQPCRYHNSDGRGQVEHDMNKNGVHVLFMRSISSFRR